MDLHATLRKKTDAFFMRMREDVWPSEVMAETMLVHAGGVLDLKLKISAMVEAEVY